MKKIVITGATSFIGTHLINELLNRNCLIYAIVRPNSGNIIRIPVDERIHVIELKMSDYNSISEYVESADLFYHFAWEGVRAPYRDDALLQYNNYVASVQAMQQAIKIGCKSFVGAGSQAEYGVGDGTYFETSQCSPVTEYGKEKLHACMELSEIACENNIHFVWTRIFSLYGKYDYQNSLVMSCIKKMRNNEDVPLTLCTQQWDYLYVEDAVRAISMLADVQVESGIYNVASGIHRPLHEFVEAIYQMTHSKSIIEFGAVPYGKSGAINLMPCVDKIAQIGWKPIVGFEEGIRLTVESMDQGHIV